MRIVTQQLADARTIRYYEPDSELPADRLAERDASRYPADTRELPPHEPASQLRFDPLRREWVTIASHRQSRTFLPPTDQCPLCPSKPGHATEIPAPDYDVAVFDNRFPSFSPALAQTAVSDGIAGRRQAGGDAEVVAFTSDHNASFASLSPAQARLVIDVWAQRTEELQQRPDVAYVYVFENRGEEIGVTLDHPHGQIYAMPFVPPFAQQGLDAAREHQRRTGRNLFADVLAAEREGPRVVTRGRYWTAFVPSFARWPYEVHLYPHRRVVDLCSTDGEERDDLAAVYLDVLGRFDRLFDGPAPLIAAWHQAPSRADRELAYTHLELFTIRRAVGKLKYLAGAESGMGAFINDIVPESAAATLRDVGV